jgi:spermidine synthase
MFNNLTHDRTAPAEYEKRRGGHFENRRVGLVVDTINEEGADSVVELGAGTGRILWRVAGARPTGQYLAVEIDENLKAYGVETYKASNMNWAARLPSDRQARVVYSIDVIHHLVDRAETFAEVHETLADAGVWFVIEPNVWHPAIALSAERMKRAGLGEDHFRPWVCEPEFAKAGFAVESRRYAHLWPASFTRPPQWALKAERFSERARIVGGSVVYLLRRR